MRYSARKKAKAGDFGKPLLALPQLVTILNLNAALQPFVQRQSRLQSQCPRKGASTLQSDFIAEIELQACSGQSPVRHP